MRPSRLSLTYLLATKNKLEYLKVVLERAIAARKSDEEIIVIDGASNDGTPLYLEDLHSKGLIQDFRSEPDIGQSHATNKGLMLAKGELVKFITDDDVFLFDEIQKCKEFMLSHPAYPALVTNMAFYTEHSPLKTVHPWLEYENLHREWMEGKRRNYVFSDLSLMIRRSELPRLGLFNPAVMFLDTEYAIRITTIAEIAFYTAVAAVRVANEKSTVGRNLVRCESECKKISVFYDYVYPPAPPPPTILQKMRRPLRKLKKALRRRFFGVHKPAPPAGEKMEFRRTVQLLVENIEQYNKSREKVFLLRDSNTTPVEPILADGEKLRPESQL